MRNLLLLTLLLLQITSVVTTDSTSNTPVVGRRRAFVVRVSPNEHPQRLSWSSTGMAGLDHRSSSPQHDVRTVAQTVDKKLMDENVARKGERKMSLVGKCEASA